MRYDETDRESKNVEDRRGEGGHAGAGGGGFQFPLPGGGAGRGGFSLTTMLIIGAIMLLFGLNPLDLLRGGQSPQVGPGPQSGPRLDIPRIPGQQQTQAGRPFQFPGAPGAGGTSDARVSFVKKVLADTEDVWKQAFAEIGRRYEEPQLVIFTRATRTACGMGMAQMGPFYCPLDKKVYIDLDFYEELSRRFRAPGDFAQAYVIAHEVGHHVQTILGIAEKVQAYKARMSEREANRLQVRMELQADCLAGVWANRAHNLRNRLQPGDIEEGLNAAAAIGDDRIQKQTQGHVVPDAFTHGSSEQRVRWFRKGLEAGDMGACDTFNAPDL